jgi:hypothetical protein
VLAGIRTNRLPTYNDDAPALGTVDVLSVEATVMSVAMSTLWEPCNVGKSFRGIRCCQGAALPACYLPAHRFIFPKYEQLNVESLVNAVHGCWCGR